MSNHGARHISASRHNGHGLTVVGARDEHAPVARIQATSADVEKILNDAVAVFQRVRQNILPCRTGSTRCLHDGATKGVALSFGGLSFHFYVYSEEQDEDVVTPSHLKRWRVPLAALARQAGRNCFDQLTWRRARGSSVLEDRDGAFAWVLLYPGPFAEHNELRGAPVMIVCDDRLAFIVGNDDEPGRAWLARKLKGKHTLHSAPLVLDRKTRLWKPAARDPLAAACSSVPKISPKNRGLSLKQIKERNRILDQNDVDGLAKLIDKGYPVNELDENGMTLLTEASWINRVDLVRALLTQHGAIVTTELEKISTWAREDDDEDYSAVRRLLRRCRPG